MNAVLCARPFITSVHLIEIFRPKGSDWDVVYLHSNFRSPAAPSAAGMAFQTLLMRGEGEDWAHREFPGVETHVYDYTRGRVLAHNPARLPTVDRALTLDSKEDVNPRAAQVA